MSRTPDLAAADAFVWRTARLLERHRYAYLFHGGSPEAVLAALRPYQNPDGGFGNALEPDARGAASQPAHVHFALQVLDEIGRLHDPMVPRALDYLAAVTAADGGVPMALRTIRQAPRAPWWDAEEEAPPGGLLPTAGIAGLLLAHGVDHPWLDGATAFCWREIAALTHTHPYEVDFCLAFLDRAPDRGRAEREAERLGRLVRAQRLVALDRDAVDVPPGYAPGEVHTPLDYAPTPASLARRWFSDAEIERSLDALAAAQGEDGGWHFNWRDWNPATTLEWRGCVTLRALTTLRAYGRLPA